MTVTVRNLDPARDLEAFVEFYNLAHADYPEHHVLTTDVVRQYVFGGPDSEDKVHFVAVEDSRIIGTARAQPETAEAGYFAILIHPERRLEGIEERLYEAAVEHLASEKMKLVRTMVHSKFPDMIRFYKERGFRDKWTHYSMKRDMGKPLQEIQTPGGIVIEVPDIEREYDVVRGTIEEGFSDTMDSTGEMMEQFDELAKEEWFSEGGIFAARNSDNGMLGVCVAAMHPALEGVGHIPWLVVLKEHRGKGLGKALLLSGLAWLKGKETVRTNLSVELGNPNALKLYTGAGFEIVSEMRYLEKRFRT